MFQVLPCHGTKTKTPDAGQGGALPDAAVASGGAGGTVAKPRLPRPADDDDKPDVISKLRFPEPSGGEIGQVQSNLGSLFQSKSFTGTNGMKLPYRLHVPDRASYKNKAPLLMFMHGAGERGYGNDSQIGLSVFIAGPGVWAIGERAKAVPMFMLAPQCPPEDHWDGLQSPPAGLQFTGSTRSMKTAMQLLDQVIKENPTIDTKRVYVMGMSMGGFATWEMISRWPEKFAGAIPMCGAGSKKLAPAILNMPIWALHGDADGEVDYHLEQVMIDYLRSWGGMPKFSLYKDVGHIVWEPAYKNEAELFPWLFSQSQ